MRLWFRTLYSMTLHGLKWWSRLAIPELLVISTVLLLVQVDTVLSKLPLVSVHWKLKLQSGTVDPQLPGMAPATPRERNWVDVPVGEECVVQIEVVRRCLRGKVFQYVFTFVRARLIACCSLGMWLEFIVIMSSFTLHLSCSLFWRASLEKVVTCTDFLKDQENSPYVPCCRRWYSYVALCPARARLPARNSLVNEVEFLGLITQNG